MNKLFTLFLGLTVVLASCGTTKNGKSDNTTTAGKESKTGIISIMHGTSFGNCRGYCIKEEVYTMTDLTTLQKAWDTTRMKPIVKTVAYSSSDFETLCYSINMKKWKALPEKIGCPDCADRGSEYVVITTKEGSKQVVFDAYSDVEQIKELLNLLREKKKTMEKEKAPDAVEE